jgi:hypothetical protein
MNKKVVTVVEVFLLLNGVYEMESKGGAVSLVRHLFSGVMTTRKRITGLFGLRNGF